MLRSEIFKRNFFSAVNELQGGGFYGKLSFYQPYRFLFGCDFIARRTVSAVYIGDFYRAYINCYVRFLREEILETEKQTFFLEFIAVNEGRKREIGRVVAVNHGIVVYNKMRLFGKNFVFHGVPVAFCAENLFGNGPCGIFTSFYGLFRCPLSVFGFVFVGYPAHYSGRALRLVVISVNNLRR